MTAMATADRRVPMWRLVMWGLIPAILLVPLVAMQFTAEVTWTPFDFVAAMVMLGGAAAAFEVARLVLRSTRQRAVAGAVIVVALVLVWLQGAVGLI